MIEGRISNQVRQLRFGRNEMSQAELGEQVGVTRQTISAIEAGKYSPSLEVAFRIAHVFGVPLADVFGWELRVSRSRAGKPGTAR